MDAIVFSVRVNKVVTDLLRRQTWQALNRVLDAALRPHTVFWEDRSESFVVLVVCGTTATDALAVMMHETVRNVVQRRRSNKAKLSDTRTRKTKGRP